MKRDTLILIDNGHGEETPGKRSPDGRLREWEWNRQAAQALSRRLTLAGYEVQLLVPERTDIGLRERVRRVNAWCAKRGASKVLLISMHVNAASADGKWHKASGFSPWVAPNASDNSKRLARLMTIEAGNADMLGDRCVPVSKFWTGNFAMVRDTRCPAVLTENFFMDNAKDVDYLLSDAGRKAIVELHFSAIEKYVNA